MQEQITNEPEPGCCVTVMRPGTALCSPCTFCTSSLPSPFFSSCHLASLPCPLSMIPPHPPSISVPPNPPMVKFRLLPLSLYFSFYSDLFFLSFSCHPIRVLFHLSLAVPFLVSLLILSLFLIPLLSYLHWSCPPFTSMQLSLGILLYFLLLPSALLLSSPLASLGGPHYELSQVD